ncbi:MAG TPA: hypothetical protein VGV91_19825, partial [Rubrobacter sp.]|nr:hypothetical protein [Rubrobacter sp.]
ASAGDNATTTADTAQWSGAGDARLALTIGPREARWGGAEHEVSGTSPALSARVPGRWARARS